MASKRNAMIRILVLATFLLSMVGCQSVSPSGRSLSESKPSTVGGTAAMSDHQKAELQIAIADAAVERGEFEAALKAYQHALREGVDRPDVLHRMALTHDKLGQVQEAQILYEKVLAQTPEDADVRCDYGYHHYLGERWPESEEHLRAAIGLKPDLSRARNILGMLLARTGRVDEALSEFARAGVPQSEAHSNIALAMVLGENESEAIRHMTLATSLKPSGNLKDRLATFRGALDSLRVRRANQSDVELVAYEFSDVNASDATAR